VHIDVKENNNNIPGLEWDGRSWLQRAGIFHLISAGKWEWHCWANSVFFPELQKISHRFCTNPMSVPEA